MLARISNTHLGAVCVSGLRNDASVRGRWRGAVVEDDLGELIYLADPPGTSGHVVSLRVLEPPSPGRDLLDCEFVVETETVKGSFPVLCDVR
ncbi:DUF5959 family protein [Streptomyces mutabilis]